MPARWRWTIWIVLVALWTTALTRPLPDFTEIAGEGIMAHRYVLAKTLHVAGYAMLAVLSGWLRAPMRWRIALMFFLMVHGTITEHIQLHVEGRTGTLEDVGFDHLGIFLGYVASWKWWSNADV